ncbi:unnamed protein product [Rotaria sp. Silwood1]|nr:unnamed protein product [Rotaria sp. Silwood1]CAF1669340.1 unnamed protein product [Rotaria sp. Silwood1]CAF3820447.1 unnamed protein product [Rotaria sp. Silwood1]CAF3903156.1 unnamed protein product [Rotaria sp. Silwood1]CAF3987092.1 unnamed protein product [Rotaria sp. Silwood1]
MFIDKSNTVNNWAAGLTSNNSTLSICRRKKDDYQIIHQIKTVNKVLIHQKLFNLNDDDLQLISDDNEIYLSQLIGPVMNKQPKYKEISNDNNELNNTLPSNDNDALYEAISDNHNEQI